MGEAADDTDVPRPRQDPGADHRRASPTTRAPAPPVPADTDAADAREASPEPFDVGSGDPATVIANARRRHGVAGGFLAAGMLGVDQAINGRKPRQEAPIVVAAPSDPIDIDRDGISVPLDDDGVFAVAAPPLPRREPVTSARRARRRAR